MRLSSWFAIGATALAAGLGSIAAAQDFPSKPVTIVVGFSAGSGTDTVTRAIADEMAKALGQPVLVENREGASGIIGANAVARSAPDGYTLLMAPTIVTINQAVRKNKPYDLAKDFTPVGLAAQAAFVLLANKDLPVSNVADLVELAKQRTEGNRVKFGSGGVGSLAHLSGELLKSAAGIDMVHVPYKGDAASAADMMAGRIDVMFTVFGTASPLISEGQVKALAIGSMGRSTSMPDLPTIAESGYPAAVEQVSWYGILGPAGLPGEVVDKLHAALVTALKSPELAERLARINVQIRSSTPQEFATTITQSVMAWEEIAQSINLVVE